MKAGSSHVAIVLLAGTAFVLLAPRPGTAAKPKLPSDSERIKALTDEERQWLTEFVAPKPRHKLSMEEIRERILRPESKYRTGWTSLSLS